LATASPSPLLLDPVGDSAQIEIDNVRFLNDNDRNIGEITPTRCDGKGRFRIERLVPGQRYRAKICRDAGVAGMALENLVLKPGEVKDLGDIRTGKPIKAMGR
jgi:hypothetical protein